MFGRSLLLMILVVILLAACQRSDAGPGPTTTGEPAPAGAAKSTPLAEHASPAAPPTAAVTADEAEHVASCGSAAGTAAAMGQGAACGSAAETAAAMGQGAACGSAAGTAPAMAEGAACGMPGSGCNQWDDQAMEVTRRKVPHGAVWRHWAVEGMHCGGCERRIMAKVGTLDGVVAVKADAGLGRVSVAVAPGSEPALDRAESLIGDIGYKVQGRRESAL
jgi:copper chaperone CopZ